MSDASDPKPLGEAEWFDEPSAPDLRLPANDTERLARAGEAIRCAREGYGDRFQWVAAALADLEAVKAGQAKAPPLSPIDMAIARIGRPAAPRLETGLASLDAMTRGGLPFGKLTLLGGAPNVGKTTLLVQLAWRAAKGGTPTAIHAADVDDAEDILTRIGQLEGLALDDLEAGSPEAWGHLARLLHGVPLLVRDQDEHEATVDDTAAELLAMAAGRPCVLAVDSMQSARSAAGLEAEGDRERIDSLVGALRLYAKKHGACVLASSELNRSAYKSRNTADRCEDIAAFKHSGALEYLTGVALVLRSAPADEGPGLVDVAPAKVKKGRRPALFRLRHEFARASFVEAELPDAAEREAADEARRDAASHARALADAERVVHAVALKPGLSFRALREALLGFNTARLKAALEAAGDRLKCESGPRGATVYYLGAVQ